MLTVERHALESAMQRAPGAHPGDQITLLDADAWYIYPLAGTPSLTVSLAQAAGGSVVSVRVDGDIDPILAARVETLLDLL
ncbi:hypothetical protein OG799_15210 [Micromonospora sp. NBC_00898]|uniref:hypothetical protein n=1 Tax=Micromonospora sp. NBC_00898 TaxID=2975981 RepID=UPI00386A121A|nr:hypothetical protein OG799_15210 [Micromonospora sp. NBC_00898]